MTESSWKLVLALGTRMGIRSSKLGRKESCGISSPNSGLAYGRMTIMVMSSALGTNPNSPLSAVSLLGSPAKFPYSADCIAINMKFPLKLRVLFFNALKTRGVETWLFSSGLACGEALEDF